jgi:type VI protein secretion system component Hcp
MLLMRIDHVIGMCELDGYDKLRWRPGGWFPIDDFSFQIKPASNDSTGRNGRNTDTGNNDSAKKTKASVTVNKPVDSATCNLMFLSMVHKAGARGLPSLSAAEKKKLTNLMVDIHYVGSVSTKKGVSTVSHYLVHLEKVEIKEWSIQASGDSRPGESLELLYEKAATCYRGLGESGIVQPEDIAGWDQAGNCKWDLGQMNQTYFPNFPK